MIIYSRFRFFLLCLLCAAGTDRDTVPEQQRKYVLFYSHCTTALFGFLTAVYIPVEEV
nr:MAG TPA: hypothetical protein [Caudoviricetes sp.]